jgi:hypothetical protein
MDDGLKFLQVLHRESEVRSRHSFGQRRFDITSASRWLQGPDQGIRRWIPAGFDAFTWLQLDSEQFQISGNQVIAIGVGGHGSSDSDDELSWRQREGEIFTERATLGTNPGHNWRWERQHVRVIYQDREWLLNEKSVADILMVLKATNAIPARVIGYRNNQRVQRTDRLNKGDVLILTEVPDPQGQITI